jgi:prepilin-type processing-associated H-X9-DG protein
MNLTEKTRYPEHKGAWWLTLFDKGVPATGILRCPSASRPGLEPYNKQENIYHHYGYNHGGSLGFPTELSLGLVGLTVRHDLGHPVKESDVVAPSEMVAIADGFASWEGKVDDGVAFVGRMFSVAGMVEARGRAKKRHSGKIVTGFADGHADSLPFLSLFEQQDPTMLRRWNRDNQDHSERLKSAP